MDATMFLNIQQFFFSLYTLIIYKHRGPIESSTKISSQEYKRRPHFSEDVGYVGNAGKYSAKAGQAGEPRSFHENVFQASLQWNLLLFEVS